MLQTQTQTAVTASGRTGQTCQKSGPYKCNTTPVVTVFVKKGSKFPVAPKPGSNAGQIATWTMVK